MIKILFMGVDVMIKLDITMEIEHPTLVLLALIFFALALLFGFAAFKLKTSVRKSMIFSAFLSLSAPVLLFLGMILQSDRLTTAGTVFPLSLLAFLLFASNLLRYRRCRESVRAKLTDCRVSSSRGWERCTPCFTYEYEGEPYESYSFLSYPKRTFQRLFETGKEYTIYIDPDEPNLCADKRRFPLSSVVFAILFLAMFVFGVVVVARG